MSKFGFTLIELLVVIAIMALVGTFAIANYRSFGEDQDLKSAVLDLKTFLKTAQNNATSKVFCEGNPPTVWRVNFENDSGDAGRVIQRFCQYVGSVGERDKKNLTFKNNIDFEKICGDSTCSSGCETAITSGQWFVTAFIPLSGKIQFSFYPDASATCLNAKPSVTIVLKNLKTTTTKKLIIEKESGRVYEQ